MTVFRPTPVPVPLTTTTLGPLNTGPTPVRPGVNTGTTPPVPSSPFPLDRAPGPVTPGPGTGNSGNTIITITVPVNEIPANIVPTPSANTSNNVVVTTGPKPGGNSGAIQFNSNGTFGGTPTANWFGTANNISYNAITINTTNYDIGAGNFARNGAIYFKDGNLTGLISGSINFKAGGRATQPGFMIAPWDLSFNNQPTRQDAGLGIWRSTQTGPFQRTQTTINGSDNGPSVHGVYVADGAIDFFPDYSSSNTNGLAYIILPAAFTDTATRRYVGQISVNAYAANTGPQWSLGWKASSPLNPTWANERAPGNVNIAWNANNKVGINNADLTESFNVLGNVRIQATGAANNTGIKFADGTFQYTAAGGGITVQEEGSNVVASTSTINFVGTGVTASNVGGVATVTVSASGDTVYNLGSISGATVVDLNNGTIQTCTLTGNVVFNLDSVTSSKSVTLLMTQGTGGNKFATYSGTVRFAAGYKTLSTAAGAVDMLNIVNIGGTYYATLTVGYTT